MNSILKFRPVGQGCFFTASIISEKGNYNLIFDCGSSSDQKVLSNEIKDFRNSLQNECIDLLVISHLEYSHVSGLKELLSGGITCKKIILPLLQPREKLFISIYHTWRYDETVDFSDYYSFLTDPVSYLKSLPSEIDEIYCIYGNDLITNELSPELHSSAIVTNNFEDSLIETFQKFDSVFVIKGNLNVQIDNHTNMYINYHQTPYFSSEEVRTAVQKMYSIDIQEVEFTESQIKDTLMDEGKRAMFKQWFNKPKLNVHSSGISIYLNNKIRSREMAQGKYYDSELIKTKLKFPLSENPIFFKELSILLTGDNAIKSLLKDQRIIEFFKCVAVLQIPMNGSISCWDKTLMQYISSNPPLVIINSGVGNNFCCPDLNVLLDLHDAGLDVRELNEFVGFEISI